MTSPWNKRARFVAAALLGASLLASAPAQAQGFRYSLATQQEFSLTRGFKLAFEDSPTAKPRKLETLRLIIAVADGKTWSFPEFKAQWQWDRLYQVRGVIEQAGGEMWLDGKRISMGKGDFATEERLEVLDYGLD